jgi:hypothetical protein
MEFHTVSLCNHCYRHIPAGRFEKCGRMILGKTCPKHGYHESILDIDANFYNNQRYKRRRPSSYWLDITNRCNLDCPHCYQMPDNTSKDPDIDYLLSEIMSWPNNGFPVSLVGAEPTIRKDLPDLILAIHNLPIMTRNVLIVTNGVILAKWDYVSRFKGIPNLKWTFGLNHPDYNGDQIRDKQMEGLVNCFKLGLEVKTLTYTLATLEQLPDVMHEVQRFGINARIQLGVEIGRVPEGDFKELYLSELVQAAEKFCLDNNWTWEPNHEDGNRTHYAVRVNGIDHKFIKWCDVRTIDLEEVQSESWASIVPGKPMSPLLHQVILRDQAINRGNILLDTVPEKYRHE